MPNKHFRMFAYLLHNPLLRHCHQSNAVSCKDDAMATACCLSLSPSSSDCSAIVSAPTPKLHSHVNSHIARLFEVNTSSFSLQCAVATAAFSLWLTPSSSVIASVRQFPVLYFSFVDILSSTQSTVFSSSSTPVTYDIYLYIGQCSRIRIFVFFSDFKKHDFLRFFEMTLKKRKKSITIILSSMMLTLLHKKEKSLLIVYRNFGLKTPRCYGYV